MRLRVGILVIGIGALLTGCGGDGSTASPSATSTVTVTATPTAAAQPSPSVRPISVLRAGQIGRLIRGQLRGVTDLTVLTEDNDPNNLIGRPGGYLSAAVLTDRDGDLSDPEPGVAWGATVEVFSSPTEAQRRMDYIQSILQSNPALGTEYGYISDRALLRVSGALKPSRAQRYERALRSIPTE